MKLSSLLKPRNYLNKIRAFQRSFVIARLVKKPVAEVLLSKIWPVEVDISNSKSSRINSFSIFGTKISLNEPINWHKDCISNFKYPLNRFDKIKLSNWYNKGIDVKFPWEVSRFYFAVGLAQEYAKTSDIKHYELFKKHLLDWLEKNPYCYGVNWYCTMEVAIRAINWIVAVNIFADNFQQDQAFQAQFNKSLVQHAQYISTFPEIYDKGRTTNHTTADHTGLLFLAISLKQEPDAGKWRSQAIKGLEHCIRYQTYDDGVNFEGSIPYHRLVLEMFAYAAIAGNANGVDFSREYYRLLFKMFEYSAAYMDLNGNAPQVGDNDSGRVIILKETDEHDHSYLLDLGEHIFNYRFRSQFKKRNPELKSWLPAVTKTDVNKLGCAFRETDKSIAFEKGGAYFLKNDVFSLLVSCFPLGQNGKGGHNHEDLGSFILSINGKPVVVDPGTYTYTADYQKRNTFRAAAYHNSVQCASSTGTEAGSNKVFGLNRRTIVSILESNSKKIKLKISEPDTQQEFLRAFELQDNQTLCINDSCRKGFTSQMIFHPEQEIKPDASNPGLIEGKNFKCIIIKAKTAFADTPYSPGYGRLQTAKKVVMRPNDKTTIMFKAKKATGR